MLCVVLSFENNDIEKAGTNQRQMIISNFLSQAHWQENRWAPTFKKHVLVFAFPPSPPFQKNLSSQGPNNLMKTGEVQTPILGTPQPVQSPLNLQQGTILCFERIFEINL